MKILTLDIETSPNIAHVWGLFNQNIGLNQLMQSTYVLCWAAKWVDDEHMYYASIFDDGKAGMLQQIYELVCEADVVITYNGIRFDMPTLNREFVQQGWPPPAPYKNIDLYRTVRSTFNFPSNKLDYVAKALGLGEKVKHSGHELWVKCLNNDPDAWKQMQDYNKKDVILTEKVYHKLQAWVKPHPNHNLYVDGDKQRCPHCGSEKVHKRGYTYTTVSKFQRYKCLECGAWSRGRKNLKERDNALVHNI